MLLLSTVSLVLGAAILVLVLAARASAGTLLLVRDDDDDESVLELCEPEKRIFFDDNAETEDAFASAIFDSFTICGRTCEK